ECPRKPYTAMHVGGGALAAPPDQYTAHMGVIKPNQSRKLSTGTGLEFSKIHHHSLEVTYLPESIILYSTPT
ncbi:MAG: hypothetical protein FWD21_04325, partial [Peptococcaceae bacterium]|nr:hypothetical protein [Peptococcaceae bacterium]